MALAHNSGIAAVKDRPRDRCEAAAGRREHKKGLRAVALLESLKGLLAIAAALVFLEIIRKNVDLEDAAKNLLYYLHIDPDGRLSVALVHAAGRLMNANVTLVMAVIFLYAAGRFIEGYGLWRQRVWAEWMAIISCAIYLPVEVYGLIRHPNGFHWLVLLVNIAVLIYVAWVRWDEVTARRAQVRLAEHGD